MDRKSNITSFLLCLAIFLAVLLSPLYPSLCLAKKVTLGWDANAEPDLEGYVVYRNVGSPGPPYKYSDTLPEDDLANPLKPMVTMTGLNEHTEYYVAVTAYDTEGNESSFSNAVCVEVVDSLIENCSTSVIPGGSSDSSSNSGNSGSGGGGGFCFINSAAGGNLGDTDIILIILLVSGFVMKVTIPVRFKKRR
jgi:hypothetical protein